MNSFASIFEIPATSLERAVKFYIREGFVIKEQKVDENTSEIEYLMLWKHNV